MVLALAAYARSPGDAITGESPAVTFGGTIQEPAITVVPMPQR